MADWPELDSARDGPTFVTLHLVSQMLGKLRVAHAPWLNHGWHATLRPSASGRMPCGSRNASRPWPAMSAITAYEPLMRLCTARTAAKTSSTCSGTPRT